MRKKDDLRSWLYLAVIWFVNFHVIGVFNSAFGIFHVIYVEEFQESNSKAGWVGSIALCSAALIYPLSIFLRRRFGFRLTILGGFFLIVFAFLSTPHMSKLEYLFITFAVPFGVAIGLIDCLTTVILREYFDNYLGVASGIRFSASGAGATAFGYILPLLFENLGWKKTMSYLSLLGTMILLCIATYRPPDTEEDKTTSCEIKFEKNTLEKRQQQKFTLVFLQNKKFLAILFGGVVLVAVLLTPAIFMMQYAKGLSYQISEAKWMLVTYSICGFFGRVFIGRIADIAIKHHKLKYILPIVALLCAVASGLCSFTQDLTLMIVFMGAFGALEGIFWVILPLVFTEILPKEQVDDAYTSVMFIMALSFLGGPPLIGWIYDVTGDFRNALYTVAACSLIACGIMIIGILLNSDEKNGEKNDIMKRSEIVCTVDLIERETNV